MTSSCEIVPFDEHVEGVDCWCAPELYQACPECVEEMTPLPDGAERSTETRAEMFELIFENPDPKCWRCAGNGYVDEYDQDFATLVVHRTVLAEA